MIDPGWIFAGVSLGAFLATAASAYLARRWRADAARSYRDAIRIHDDTFSLVRQLIRQLKEAPSSAQTAKPTNVEDAVEEGRQDV